MGDRAWARGKGGHLDSGCLLGSELVPGLGGRGAPAVPEVMSMFRMRGLRAGSEGTRLRSRRFSWALGERPPGTVWNRKWGIAPGVGAFGRTGSDPCPGVLGPPAGGGGGSGSDPNARRRRPLRRRDGTFNYSPDVYCSKYDEASGVCPDGDEPLVLVGRFVSQCGKDRVRLGDSPCRGQTDFAALPALITAQFSELPALEPTLTRCPYLHRTTGDTERKYHLRYYKTGTCIHETDARGHCVKNGLHCAFGLFRGLDFIPKEKVTRCCPADLGMGSSGVLGAQLSGLLGFESRRPSQDGRA
ncbi:PREDICTED: uncharacterized protein LOC104986126 [Bison bison bison]|uniref:Uncharacterized protein LOC104986126 n=1 Tax=Bison bison bison TaxID=43346 RepID=A0A6P3H6Q7_BISBB|nr:PREDICTED: uncharacterized protein LOC104986126 [Bison bison bison]